MIRDALKRAGEALEYADVEVDQAECVEDAAERLEHLTEAATAVVGAIPDLLTSLALLRDEGAPVERTPREEEAVLAAVANFGLLAEQTKGMVDMVTERIGAGR